MDDKELEYINTLKNLGYRVFKPTSPLKKLPCTCGASGRDLVFKHLRYSYPKRIYVVCQKCKKSSLWQLKKNDAIRSWNEIVSKKQDI